MKVGERWLGNNPNFQEDMEEGITIIKVDGDSIAFQYNWGGCIIQEVEPEYITKNYKLDEKRSFNNLIDEYYFGKGVS